ncbi:MAG: sodium:calcium antiporter [Chitinispirillaceae bacterium]|nr:sodium:calcium antiporter [Chitinispirillaceae bacterium]
MEALITSLMAESHLALLLVVIAVMLFILTKGADLLVDEAVSLSLCWGVPKMLIGATIVSIGTTIPETAVSVVAALQGKPGLALGNAVGSVICDTGLILGIAALIAPLPLPRAIINRQGWIQVGAGVIIVLLSIPYRSPLSAFTSGGHLSRWVGILFLGLLSAYILTSIRQVGKGGKESPLEKEMSPDIGRAGTGITLLKLTAGIALVILSSKMLIPAVAETAMRLHIPQSVIGATIVAFGTSLPELMTAITSARKGHGELAVGNIIGADILNILFVSGSAIAVTRGGLHVPPSFFIFYFPAMIAILLTFRIGALVSRTHMHRTFAFVLLGIYAAITMAGYLLKTIE